MIGDDRRTKQTDEKKIEYEVEDRRENRQRKR